MSEDRFHIKGLSLDNLRTFLRVAKEASMAEAARQSRTTDSNISHQIAALERVLGKQLTIQRGKATAITPAGRQLEKLASTFLEEVSAFAKLPFDDIRIGGGDRILHWLLLPELPHIRNTLMQKDSQCFQNPVFRLVCYPDEEIVRDLRSMHLDLALVGRRKGEEIQRDTSTSKQRLYAQKVHELPYAFFVPKRLLPRAKIHDTSWIVRNIPFVDGSDFAEDILRAAYSETGRALTFKCLLICENFPQACTAVSLGEYAGVLPSAATRELSPRQFYKLPIPFIPEKPSVVHIAWNEDIKLARVGADILLSVFIGALTNPGSPSRKSSQ
jgi:DNA-binding transcriptional LysR family regulator